jgi:uncharacterized protein (DUF2384 family)
MSSAAASSSERPDYEHFFTPELLKKIDGANRRLAVEAEVPTEVEKVVLEIANRITQTSEREFDEVDPYLSNAFHRGLTVSLLGVKLGSKKRERRLLRIGLEQMRQAVRDVVEGRSVQDDVELKDRVRWLANILHVPQAELAELLFTNQRQIQRWLSTTDQAEPRGDDAWRVDLVARIVNHLRHVMTAQGVIYWFESPHPDLKGETPASLLEEPTEHAGALIRLASGARSHAAS